MKLSEALQKAPLHRPDTPEHPFPAVVSLQWLSRSSNDFYQELTMDSPFADTYQDVLFPASGSVPLHSHPFYELLYFRSCTGMEYLVGSERYKLQKGDLVLVGPGVAHCPILPTPMPEPYIRDVLWISQDYFALLSERIGDEACAFPGVALLRTAGTRWEFLGELFQVGVAEAEDRQSGWELAVAANTATILIHMHRAYAAGCRPLPAEKPALLEQVLGYIEGHLTQRLSLEEVARHFFISQSTITQTFRKKMGVSFYRYVTQRRLLLAKTLIENGAPLETVAEQAGFTDYSAFFRAFKQEHGVSPRQYRKLHANPEQPPAVDKAFPGDYNLSRFGKDSSRRNEHGERV